MVSRTPRHDDMLLRPGPPRLLWLAGAVLLWGVATTLAWPLPLNNDVSWQYWVARQLRHGAVFYRDITEVNPPLWFWAALPVSAIADWLDLPTAPVVVGVVMAKTVLALALVAAVLPDMPRRQLLWCLLGMGVLLFLLPLRDFGEREHATLLGAMPYAALIAARGQGQRVPVGVAVIIGLLAAYGFALKHYFVVIPLALEVWLVWTLRARRIFWAWRRGETCVLAVCAVLYVVAIVVVAPEYITGMLPTVRAAYGAFGEPFSTIFLHQLFLPVWLLGAVALWLTRKETSPATATALITAAGFLVCYVVQAKGWSYHALPVTAMLCQALVMQMAVAPLRHPLGLVVIACALALTAKLGLYKNTAAPKIEAALQSVPSGSSVAILSAHSWLAFPMVEDKRLLWPLHGIGLWTVPAIAHGERSGDLSPALRAVRSQTLHRLADDLWCHPPQLIIIDDARHSPALDGTGFSYQKFLRSDRRIKALFRNYEVTGTIEGITFLRPVRNVQAQGTACRTVSVLN
jgi:hypothetical protein